MGLEKLKSIFSNLEKFNQTDLTQFDSQFDDITSPSGIPKKIEVLGLVPIGVRKNKDKKQTAEKKKLIHTEIYGK